MKTIIGLLFAVATVAAAQEFVQTEPTAPAPPVPAIAQDDPGQGLYKKGYEAILAKKWSQAREHFTELLKKHPKSKYVDAAQYWTAYSYTQTDKKKAADLYRRFIEQYRQSQYFDDAVADFEALALGEEKAMVLSPVPPRPPRPAGVPTVEAPRVADAERALESAYAGVVATSPKKEIDPAVQLKMDAVRALGANPDDPQAYETVKAIALDTKQPTELREAALQTISRFADHNPVDVYVQVASSGDVRLRLSAIYGIGNVAEKGDKRALSVLRDLAQDAQQPRDIRGASLSSLSRLDEEGMFETLSKIARSDPDQKLRIEALYLIGREGQGQEQRALAILKDVASDESQARQVREAAVQALSMITSDESLAFLKGVATGSQDKRLRLNALYALSRYQDGASAEVEQTLRTIARNDREDYELRLAALYGLRASGGTGSRDLMTSLALKDKDAKMRQAALHILIETSEDKAQILSTLIQVFEKGGEENREFRETALYGIASVGNDEAVSYLANVAKGHADYGYRRRAVYYLGSVGGEKAKAALLDILKEQ